MDRNRQVNVTHRLEHLQIQDGRGLPNRSNIDLHILHKTECSFVSCNQKCSYILRRLRQAESRKDTGTRSNLHPESFNLNLFHVPQALDIIM